MKLFLTVALLLSQLIPVFAQAQDQGDSINPTPTLEQSKIKVIKLNANIPVHHFGIPIKSIQMIATCGDSINLGYLPYRRSNLRTLAVPDKPLQDFLQEYVNKQYGDQYKRDNGKDLLCLIQYLRIAEGDVEKAYVRMKAVAFLSSDNQQFQLSYQIDTTLVYDNKRSKRAHSENMAQAIDLLMQAADKQNITTAFHSRDEILNIAWRGYKQPIYTTSQFNDGIYTSYREFLKNTPSVANFTLGIEYGKVVAYNIHDDSTCNIINHPWGMCYQGQLYRYNVNWFIPIQRQGLFFMFTDPEFKFDQDVKITGAQVAGYVGQTAEAVAGLLLFRVFRMPGFPVPVSNLTNTIPYMNNMIDPPLTTMIDAFTGELMF